MLAPRRGTDLLIPGGHTVTDDGEVLQHILRTPLPWRDAARTACGLVVDELAAGRVLTLDEGRAKIARLGKQRASMFLCMTCCNRAPNWPEWDRDPVERMARECERGWGNPEHRVVVERDLRAIAALIVAHRGEFDDLVRGQVDGIVVSLSTLRTERRRGAR